MIQTSHATHPAGPSTRARPLISAALLVCALLPSTPTLAQNAPVARVGGGGLLEIWNAPENGAPATLELSGVSPLPVQLAGAAHRDRHRADLPTLSDPGPMPHVSLPDGGSLYLISRAGETGVLHVDLSGVASLALSLPDAGGPSLQPWLAVSNDGGFALVSTTLAAGGDVLLLDLVGGAPPRSLGGALAPLPVDGLSLRVSAQRAFFVAAGALYGADLPAGTPAAPIDLGQPGSSPLPETAMSGDGLCVGVVTEDGVGDRHIVVVDAAFAAVTATTTAADYDTPNYDNPFGPWLVLSDDGCLVAFRGTVIKTELFIREVASPTPATQVTADPNFVDTMDNVGILGFALPGAFTFFAGELNAGPIPGALGSADMYLATVGAGGSIALTNVTMTSGVGVTPYQPGELELTDAVLDPTGERLLVVIDPDVGDAELISLPTDGTGAMTSLLPALLVPPNLAGAGESLLITSQPELGFGETDIHLLRPVGAPVGLQLLSTAPHGVILDRFASDRLGLSAAFVASIVPGIELPVLVDQGTGLLLPAWLPPTAITPALAFTPGGRLALGVGNPGGPYFYAALDGFMTGVPLRVPVGDGFPLSY